MLEISDVVETAYTQNEKMLDLRQPEKTQSRDTSHKVQTQDQGDIAGFEDYIEEQPKIEGGSKSAKSGNIENTPGFEDYLEDKPKDPIGSKTISKGAEKAMDTPGFEDYLDK
jgi:hypothetical protein